MFYRQGYNATGINEIIEKSEVAKATFYAHFPAKDDLCLAYLRELKHQELEFIETAISAAKDPVGRFLAVIDSLGPWSKETNYRGCAFMNIASEIPDPSSPLRREGQVLYDGIRSRVGTLAAEMIASDRKRFGKLDARKLADAYMIVFSGCAAAVGIYHDITPVRRASDLIRGLIGLE